MRVRPILLHLLVCIFYALHYNNYNKPSKSENHKIYISLIKLELLVYSLRDILNYEIFINEFQYSDSGVGIVSDLGVVWCSYNECTNHLRVYRRLLPSCLHGKVAELCLAYS